MTYHLKRCYETKINDIFVRDFSKYSKTSLYCFDERTIIQKMRGFVICLTKRKLGKQISPERFELFSFV